jgi:serine/threonine protein kinase
LLEVPAWPDDMRMAADPDATQRVTSAQGGSSSISGSKQVGVSGTAPGTFNPDATQRVLPSDVDVALTSGQRVFGRYRLEAEVGRGGMGVVWRARDEELGETVALKFLPTAVARDAAAVDELKEETRRARRLTHPNIVRIHDFVRDATMAAVSMEFVDGQTLSHLRLEQPGKVFSAESLTPMVKQICAALDYAHAQAKIVHRDLKPANILVTRDGFVKITDFGIARSLTETHTRLTGVGGGTSGTLLYMSPQQVLGKKPTAADDIYALGATLYELLTTKPPFHRGDPYSLMMQIRDSTPLSLAEQRADLEVTGVAIPREWQKTILACLAKEPTQRPATIQELAKRLAGEGTSHPLPSPVEIEQSISESPALKAGSVAPNAKLKLRQTGDGKHSKVPFTRGGFVVHVFPPEAKALVSIGPANDVPVESGQAIIRDLFDREYELTVQALGFLTHTSKVSVAGGGGVATVELQPVFKQQMSGKLTIKSTPSGAEVLMDGRVVGETPLTCDQPPGLRLVVEVRKKGHKPRIVPVTLHPGEERRLEVTLSAEPEESYKNDTSDRSHAAPNWTSAVIFGMITAYFLVALVDYSPNQSSLFTTGPTMKNICGQFGANFIAFFLLVFGTGTFLLPVFGSRFVLLAVRSSSQRVGLRFTSAVICLVANSFVWAQSTGSIATAYFPQGFGGRLGRVYYLLSPAFGRFGDVVIWILVCASMIYTLLPSGLRKSKVSNKMVGA